MMTRRRHQWSRRGLFGGLVIGALPYVAVAGSILGEARDAPDQLKYVVFWTLLELVVALATVLVPMAIGAACGWCLGWAAAFVYDRMASSGGDDPH